MSLRCNLVRSRRLSASEISILAVRVWHELFTIFVPLDLWMAQRPINGILKAAFWLCLTHNWFCKFFNFLGIESCGSYHTHTKIKRFEIWNICISIGTNKQVLKNKPSTAITHSVLRPSASNRYFPANSSVTLSIFSLWTTPSLLIVNPSEEAVIYRGIWRTVYTYTIYTISHIIFTVASLYLIAIFGPDTITVSTAKFADQFSCFSYNSFKVFQPSREVNTRICRWFVNTNE